MRTIYNEHSTYTQDYLIRDPKILKEDGDFFKWIDRIDAVVKEVIGIDLLDLPDQLYRDMFNDGEDFRTVARKIVDGYRQSFIF